jgi:hypothetical protein
MQDQLLRIALDLREMVVSAAPRVIVGIVVVIAMLIVAKLVERVLRAMLVRMHLDALLKQAGLDVLFQRVGIRESLNQLLPRLVYFLLLLIFAQTAADGFGLTAIADGIRSMFAYLPNVIAAMLIIVVGVSVSQFAGTAVTRAADESGIEFARSLGSMVSGLILFLVAVMAIGQLQFDTAMVRIVTACVLSGMALAFGLSLGLGTRDITRNVLAGFYARKLFAPGDALEIRGERGRLVHGRQHRLSRRDDPTLVDDPSGSLRLPDELSARADSRHVCPALRIEGPEDTSHAGRPPGVASMGDVPPSPPRVRALPRPLHASDAARPSRLTPGDAASSTGTHAY